MELEGIAVLYICIYIFFNLVWMLNVVYFTLSWVWLYSYLFICLFIYLGCIGSQLQHAGSLLRHAGFSLVVARGLQSARAQ